MSQRSLAAAIRRSHSHISMIERGQRRVDALEFYLIARALGHCPGALYSKATEAIDGARAGPSPP